MIGELVCPDCGGVVGATEPTDAGPPCRCFADGSGTSGLSSSMSGTMAGGVPGEASDASASDLPMAAPVKVCRLCGTDVAGHRRFKDSLGYLCVPCAKAEEMRENQGRVRCRVCGKLVKEENLTDYEGTRMCPQCHGERREMRLQEIKRIGFKGARTRDELRQLYIYLAIGAVLLLFILAGVIINHFRH